MGIGDTLSGYGLEDGISYIIKEVLKVYLFGIGVY